MYGRLLQMPLACVRIDFRAGESECYILEHRSQTNYESIIGLLKNVVHKDSSTRSSLSRHEIKSLPVRSRTRVCSIYKASGDSNTSPQAIRFWTYESAIKEGWRGTEACSASDRQLINWQKQRNLRDLGIKLAETDCDTSSDESKDEDETEQS